MPVDRHNFLLQEYDNIFALGDAAALPTSKAGSVAHFAVEIWTENFLRYIDGLEMTHEFDGHANCFIESGFGKGILIDFNYDVEPLPGKFPLPGVGPFSLAAGVGDEPLGQDDVPLDVLEHPAQGQRDAASRPRCRWPASGIRRLSWMPHSLEPAATATAINALPARVDALTEQMVSFLTKRPRPQQRRHGASGRICSRI